MSRFGLILCISSLFSMLVILLSSLIDSGFFVVYDVLIRCSVLFRLLV